MSQFDIIKYLKEECMVKNNECPICFFVMNKSVALLHSKKDKQDVHHICNVCFSQLSVGVEKPPCPLCRNVEYSIVLMDREQGLLYLYNQQYLPDLTTPENHTPRRSRWCTFL